jgi:hypothetical protein
MLAAIYNPLMSDKNSFIIKPRDPSEIIRSQDSAALSEFLKDPPSLLAGALIEAFSHGPSALTGPLVRVGVSALKGRALQQFAKEIKDLREKGRLADDFAENKYGFQSWVELIQIIDDDTPDEDRLEALKAMFYAANTVNVTDGQQIVAYQLFQIAKKLNSNELLVMKAVYELFLKESQFRNSHFREWAQAVARHLGHAVIGLVEVADKTLVDNQLLSGRFHDDLSGISSTNCRLTELGIEFCKNIERYRLDAKP